MNLNIIQVPYDSGHRNVGMGKGPGHIMRALDRSGPPSVHNEEVIVESGSPLEIGTTIGVAQALSTRVREAAAQNHLPLVLAGNCASSLGTLAGQGAPVAIVWLDAHGDFNTPETTVSGYFDGMALATATGRCWRQLASTIPGFQPTSESHVVLVGARDFDPAERELLASSAVTLIPTETIRQASIPHALEAALERIRGFTQRVYLHIDLDVLDIAEARVNRFSCPGGLKLAELLEIVRFVTSHSILAAAAITAYDPAYDEGVKAVQAAVQIISLLRELPLSRTLKKSTSPL